VQRLATATQRKLPLNWGANYTLKYAGYYCD
jgi:hypothetical protein